MRTKTTKTDKLSVWDVGNQHGYQCPSCGAGDSLYISATVTAALLPDGCDTGDSDTEWEDTSPAWCGCGWNGKVADFKEVEVDDDN